MTSFASHHGPVLAAVEAGCSLRDAAREAGVAPRTVKRWLARGRREQAGAHQEFTEAVEKVWAARELPASDDPPMGDGELRVAVSEAARAGSVPAMKLYWEMLLADRERRPNPLAEFDELARRRARR